MKLLLATCLHAHQRYKRGAGSSRTLRVEHRKGLRQRRGPKGSRPEGKQGNAARETSGYESGTFPTLSKEARPGRLGKAYRKGSGAQDWACHFCSDRGVFRNSHRGGHAAPLLLGRRPPARTRARWGCGVAAWRLERGSTPGAPAGPAAKRDRAVQQPKRRRTDAAAAMAAAAAAAAAAVATRRARARGAQPLHLGRLACPALLLVHQRALLCLLLQHLLAVLHLPKLLPLLPLEEEGRVCPLVPERLLLLPHRLQLLLLLQLLLRHAVLCLLDQRLLCPALADLLLQPLRRLVRGLLHAILLMLTRLLLLMMMLTRLLLLLLLLPRLRSGRRGQPLLERRRQLRRRRPLRRGPVLRLRLVQLH